MRFLFLTSLVVWLAASVGCGGGKDLGGVDQGYERRTVVWLEGSNLGSGLALRLERAGVDEVAVRRGTIHFSGGSPVFRLGQEPRIPGSVPVGFVFLMKDLPETMDPALARTTWQAIKTDIGALNVVELILDLPRLQPGLGDFIVRLSEVAGIPVVPLLSPNQLRREDGLAVAAAAGVCIVATNGADDSVLRGLSEMAGSTLAERLEPLGQLEIPVRIAIVLKPKTEPVLETWGESLDILCENDLTRISTSSSLDRTFVFNRAATWSGREWSEGESVAVRWMDAARLDLFIRETEHMILPQLAGWDLVPAVVAPSPLGISADGVIEYLSGRGPALELDVEVRRVRSDRLEVSLVNNSPFTSAVSSFGNWLEVTVGSGALVAQDRGSFDHIVLGSRRNGEWQAINANVVDGVRFQETFVAGNEVIRSGVVRIPSRRSEVTVRWHVTLTTGQVVEGQKTLQ